MIKVEGLTKRYARNVAVDNISFEVDKGPDRRLPGTQRGGENHDHARAHLLSAAYVGSVEVAGFDVLENPMEVKRRIGYLPESPPVYPEMEVHEYLEFVGRIKGVPSADLTRRVDEVSEKCAITDVAQDADREAVERLPAARRSGAGDHPQSRRPDPGRADRGARPAPDHRDARPDQRPGARGEHTIILSTHILPEVEQTCERVIIIAKGKLVATDTVANLTSRLRGAETVAVEVIARDGRPIAPALVQAKLEQVAGVSRVLPKEHRDGNLSLHGGKSGGPACPAGPGARRGRSRMESE